MMWKKNWRDSMERIKKVFSKGLTAHQIKILAVIFMTIDHLGAYGFEIPVFSTYNYQLRLIGRLAMPLFLFCLTDSIRYTRSRPRFLLRLYLTAVGVSLFTSVTNYFFGDTIGRFILANIIYTYLYVAIYTILIENILKAVRNRQWKRGFLSIGGIVATAIPHFLFQALASIPFQENGLTFEQKMLIRDLIESFIKSPWGVDYTLLFVLMGVLMYFAKNKYGKAVVLVAFVLLCYFAERAMWTGSLFWEWILLNTPLHTVLGSLQSKMILAAPIMLLYNGQKGKESKWFFYWYYPLHRYVISIVQYLYLLFFAA